jgi:hypothetical protein
MIQKTVMNLGCIEAVLNHKGWDGHEDAKTYAIAFAEKTFSTIQKLRSPYRKGDIKFPIKPSNNIPLDIDVEMRPASGLAKVKIFAKDSTLLNGRAIIFDYSRMEEVSEIPQLPRAWPEIIKITCARDSSINNNAILSSFMESTIDSHNYIDLMNEIKEILCQPVMEQEESRIVYRKKIDQNGRTYKEDTQHIIDALSKKIDGDFLSLNKSTGSLIVKDLIIKRSTWLWAKTPPEVIDFLNKYYSISQPYNNTWLYYIEAASRCFTKVDQYKVLFETIYRRMTNPPKNGKAFPIQSMRSIWRILIYRQNGQNGLSHKMAIAFILRSVLLIQEQLNERNFERSFFQAILLFFILLRYRKIENQFMSPENPQYKTIFKKVEDCLTNAQELSARYDIQRSNRVTNLLNGIKDYMHYKGTPGLIHQLREEAGDND